jgi:hypothetical protein
MEYPTPAGYRATPNINALPQGAIGRTPCQYLSPLCSPGIVRSEAVDKDLCCQGGTRIQENVPPTAAARRNELLVHLVGDSPSSSRKGLLELFSRLAGG